MWKTINLKFQANFSIASVFLGQTSEPQFPNSHLSPLNWKIHTERLGSPNCCCIFWFFGTWMVQTSSWRWLLDTLLGIQSNLPNFSQRWLPKLAGKAQLFHLRGFFSIKNGDTWNLWGKKKVLLTFCCAKAMETPRSFRVNKARI